MMRTFGFVLAVLAFRAAPAPGAQQPAVPPGPMTLVEAIQRGRTQGINATLAELGARSARARVGQQRSELLPNIGASLSLTRQTLNLDEFGIPVATGVTDPFTVYALQVRAGQTLFDAGAINRLRVARDAAVAAGLDARSVGELAAATAGLAYLRVLSADETVRARLADSAVAAALQQQAHELVNAGVNPAIDATRSDVSFAAVRAQLEVARNAAGRTRLDLLRALDLPPGAKLELADSLGIGALHIPLDPDTAGQFAREHRSELVAERARTEAVRHQLRAIHAEYLPSLGLGGTYRQSGRQTDALSGTYNVQLQVSVPILDGFRRQRRADEQQVQLEAQALRERDLGNQVETEARQAVLDLASARQQADIAIDRLRLAEQELAQAQDRFRSGVAGSVETTTAQSAVIAARDAVIQARVSYGSARVSAYRALGVLDQLE